MKNKITLIVFWVLVILIALVVIFNFGFARDLIERTLTNYFSVFILAFLADLIAQPIGPEFPSILALIRGFNPWIIFSLVVLGSVLASMINFFIGKGFLSNKILAFCKIDKRMKYCKLFSKYGKYSLLVASISPVPYVVFCYLSGSFEMKFIDFIKWGIIPRIARIFVVIFVLSESVGFLF